MVVDGTLDALNRAVYRLKYVCAETRGCYAGDDVVTFVLSDNGNTGVGGALTSTAVMEIEVLPPKGSS